MKHRLSQLIRVCFNFVASTKFFVLVLVVFSIQAVWLAISAVYPLPFDEYYHYGLIGIYADQWSPFIKEQPLYATLYGDVTRDTSYLYHYLMSFPYRLIDLFTDSEMVKVIFLRLLNVGMIAGALVLFRKLLLDNGVSSRVTNVVLALFALTPIVTLLSAHINYDNLMLLVAPVVLMVAMNVYQARGNLFSNTLLLAALSMLILLIKDTFAPALIAIVGFLGVALIWKYRTKVFREYFVQAKSAIKTTSFAAVILLLVVVGSLFVERFVGNYLQYGSARADCEVVQSHETCLGFGPYYNRQLILERTGGEPSYDLMKYSTVWLDEIMRGYFAIFSHSPSQVVSNHEPYGPIVLKPLLPLSLVLGFSALVLGLLAILICLKQLWRQRFLRFALVVGVAHIGIVFIHNYLDFLQFGEPIRMQARYTLPVLVLLLVVTTAAVSRLVRRRWMKLALLLVFVLPYLYIGGIAGRLVRHDPAWIWPEAWLQNVSWWLHNIFVLIMPS